jgi:hypothetical protein
MFTVTATLTKYAPAIDSTLPDSVREMLNGLPRYQGNFTLADSTGSTYTQPILVDVRDFETFGWGAVAAELVIGARMFATFVQNGMPSSLQGWTTPYESRDHQSAVIEFDFDGEV